MKAESSLSYTLQLEAAFFLIIAKLLIRLLPYKYWHRLLNARSSETVPQSSRLIPIKHAILHVSHRLPGGTHRFRCLSQAIAATWILRLRGLPFTLHIGVQRAQVSDFRILSHAWVMSGDQFVAGEPRRDDAYQTMLQFGNTPR